MVSYWIIWEGQIEGMVYSGPIPSWMGSSSQWFQRSSAAVQLCVLEFSLLFHILMNTFGEVPELYGIAVISPPAWIVYSNVVEILYWYLGIIRN